MSVQWMSSYATNKTETASSKTQKTSTYIVHICRTVVIQPYHHNRFLDALQTVEVLRVNGQQMTPDLKVNQRTAHIP